VRAGASLDELIAEVRRQAAFAAMRTSDDDREKAAEQLHISLAQLDKIIAGADAPAT
jgi:hypothetical protein